MQLKIQTEGRPRTEHTEYTEKNWQHAVSDWQLKPPKLE